MENENLLKADVLGDNHMATSSETPLREDAFVMEDDLKIKLISQHFGEIMHILGLDLEDESLKGTPMRVAKMFVNESFSGLDPKNKPAATLFENNFQYTEMLVEKNISFFSTCEHHFVPIEGKAHVAYISSGKVIGLSKLNRIVQYYAKRPQVQERMTVQIANEIKEIMKTDDVAVVIDARHLCVASRGINDLNSATVTSAFFGQFNNPSKKEEFLKYLELK